ncbi:MAG TPA: aspartate carbamoyltransferase catalytic subunit [candidate division Zixibacteria bacterium]|nr:aspartate carbamoyltransferase catalytic subunit [candidate division Zixibacteria bacterium]
MKEHLLGLEGYTGDEILEILELSKTFRQVLDRDVKRLPTLKGITVANLFFEPSTRTRMSFELAEKRLSADVINFSASTSSVKKGENLRDTVDNIGAMKVDMTVIRHGAVGSAQFIAKHCKTVVINAGDGAHEHPTQALLDFYTIREHFPDFKGLKVCIVGDALHSRVIRSNVFGLKALGADVTLCAPSTLLPMGVESWGVKVNCDIEEAIRGANVVNIMRLQLERQTAGYIPSLREYGIVWGINSELVDLMDKDHIIMHPGPMNRGVEITQDVADAPESVILPQVTNGVAVRMAILYLLAPRSGDIHE